jgi:hypothetical protein
MALLPVDFQFSQSSLQDYTDCPRRFLLRHLLRVTWPALEAEPVLENELAMQRGAQFHSLVQQHLLGIPAEILTLLSQEEALSRGWQAYLSFTPAILKGARFPEITLSAPLLRYRLLAKYDLLVISQSGQVVIYDWKTSAKKPRRQSLLGRMQTRVYPYLLVQAGAFLNQGIPFQPEQVEMVYWFTEAPAEPEVIAYSAEQYQKDGQYLESLAGEIAGLEQDAFNLTPLEERCRFCTYRSLCERGVSAGSLDAAGDGEVETSQGEDFNFEQIAEIAF